MPNSPDPETVTVSFTLPRELAAAVAQHAKKGLTNKSDIIRRALLAYIPTDEADRILGVVLNEAGNCTASPTQMDVTYPAKKRKDK